MKGPRLAIGVCRGMRSHRLGRLLPAVAAVAVFASGCSVPSGSCTTTVSGTAAVQSAVNAAKPGATVCLANGSYGKLTLSASKAAPGVNVRPVTPGGASLAGASLAGSYLALSQFKVVGDEVTVQPGSTGMTVNHNRISGGYFGVDAGPTTTTNINDVTIVGNQFIGPFGEDGIRANRYHDGPDANPGGMVVIGNEFTNIRENGNHSDCFQSVWGGDHLYFVDNYLHDNRCQGLFIKDQPSTVDTVVVDDNLMVRNGAACGPPLSSCGEPSVLQLFGPMSNLAIRRNTIWTPEGGSPVTLRNSGWSAVTFQNNVVYRAWSDTSSPFASYSASGNVGCSWEGTWPATGYARVCTPKFVNPVAGDYRVPGAAGVTWKLSDQHFGP